MRTLSESALDKLATPLVQRQERINMKVLLSMAKKIRLIGQITPSDLKKLFQMRQVGADVDLLLAELAKEAALQEAMLRETVMSAARQFYAGTREFYEFRKKPFVKFEKNAFLNRRAEAVARVTAGTYRNISKAQAFMFRDPKNPKILVPTTIAKTYQSVIDEAVQAVQGGVTDYNSAMRGTVERLADSGIRTVNYEAESGRRTTQRAEAAVRRNVLDGVRAVNQEVQKITGEQFGADGVEITVHMNPAPDHEQMQGHQYYNSEFDKMQDGEDFLDVQGRKYAGFDRAVGTLNCRHFAVSIIVGHASQTYTDAQLENILKENKKGYTLPNGKHLTGYECTQKQREYERKIKRAKEKAVLCNAFGDAEGAGKWAGKSAALTREYKEFSKACGLKFRGDKIRVDGYRW